MTYFPPDIIDNATTIFAEALQQTILKAEQRQLDIATGYFAPEVWRIVGNALAELRAFRLLLGERPDVPMGGPETIDLRRYYRAKIADDLARLSFDRQHAELVDALLAFLTRDEVQVRLFSGPFLHAKAYIFDRISFVGSGNFTPSGLTRNSELMLTSMSQAVARGLREWFEGKWTQSEDYKPDLIDTLRASKFGSKSYTPFEVFMKALYEYFKERIVLEQDRAATVDLARFQEEGKAEAIRLLDKWGGVLVADAVGLGKTYIGLSLLERELLSKRQRGRIPRGLVIRPAQLRDLVWRPRLVEYGIPVVDVLSQEEIGRADFDWKRYRDLDVVLVDESHNFRNPGTNRYRNLMKLLTGGRRKRVILMTATPVNNSLYDFYYQLLLLARGDEHFYRSMGISSLRAYFKAATEGGLEIFDLLEETTVRRSRADIRRRQEAGEEVIVSGKPVRFPERVLERIDYDLDGTYRGLYHEITDALERLYLVAYNLAAYARTKTKATEQDEQRNNALIALMKMLYLKRLESSAAAFEESIKRQVSFQSAFLKMLQDGRLLDAASYRKLLAIEEDEERPERAEEIIGVLAPVSPDDYQMQRIEEGVSHDITVLESILYMLKKAREGEAEEDGDDKLRQIKTALAGPLEGHKVLIFTSFHDTAVYLHKQLLNDRTWQEQAGGPVLGLISGETRPEERRRLIERFAPVANRPPEIPGDQPWKPDGSEIQVLISTDVLSEGLNLQDAGVVINYDLHWNPVRLIQRAGRVDRIGSSFAQILLYNVFPEAELESLLGLVQRLSARIAQIDQTVGLDASVLGEVISQRSLEQLRQLHRNDQSLLRDLERQAELVSTEEMKFPLINYIQQIGERVVAELPLGIHSGKHYVARDARPGVFVAFSAGGRHFWRFYPDDESLPEKNIRSLYPMIACTREEPRIEPGPVPYDLLEHATQDILANLRGEQARNRVRPALTGMAQKLYNWLNRSTLWQENEALDPDQLRRFNGVLEQVSLRPFERDRALRTLVKAYEGSSDFAQLVADLDSFFTENGLTQLPDFQRGWVWDDEHIRSLLASISLSYPIGAVMMLQTGGNGVRFKPRPVEGVSLVNSSFPERLILDGQQRLTSLFLSLYSNRPVETKDVRGTTIRRWYYLDMQKILDPHGDREDAIVGLPESRQVLNFRGAVEADYSMVEQEYQAGLFPLSQVFDCSEWRSGYNESWDYSRERTRLFDQFEKEVIKRFEQYQIPLILLRKETPKDAVCQVFEKVNTGGVALTVFELLTATYASDDYNLRDDWAARQKRLRKQKVLASLENTDFLQAVTLLATYAYKAHNPEAAISCKRKDILRLTLDEYRNWAEPATQGFEKAARLLFGQKIFAARDLPYRTQLTPLAAILALLGDRADNDGVRTKLIRWYWCGVFGELYGGAIETRFAKDLPEVLNWIDSGSLPATIADANFAPSRLLTLQTRNSAAYKGVFALLLHHGGLDFRSGTPIDEQMYFDDKIDIHHIFPQDWCKKNSIDQRRCDSIVNKTALSSKTNRMIGGNAPSTYLSRSQRSAGIDDIRMNQILRSHLIDPVSLRSDDFESFFRAREAALLGRIEEAMGKRIARDIPQEIAPGDLASVGEYQDEEES